MAWLNNWKYYQLCKLVLSPNFPFSFIIFPFSKLRALPSPPFLLAGHYSLFFIHANAFWFVAMPHTRVFCGWASSRFCHENPDGCRAKPGLGVAMPTQRLSLGEGALQKQETPWTWISEGGENRVKARSFHKWEDDKEGREIEVKVPAWIAGSVFEGNLACRIGHVLSPRHLVIDECSSA